MWDRLLIDRLKEQQDLAFYQTNVSPHGITQRASLTIPSDRMGYIPYVFMLARRRSAATSNPFVYMVMNYTPAGGTTRPILELYLFGNTDEDWESVAVPIGLWLFEGDSVAFSTYDGSTGGAVDYTIRAVAYELY